MEALQSFFRSLQLTLKTVLFLKLKTNPVASGKAVVNLEHALVQYQTFTRHVAHLLGLARQGAVRQGWDGVARELARNIGQELGSDSEGVPHHQLLATALRREFLFDVHAHTQSAATDRFIRRLLAELGNKNAYRAVGAAYALEDTAVPELEVVLSLVRYLAAGRPLAAETKAFFDHHLKVWEPSHEKELRLAAAPLLGAPSAKNDFQAGFMAVMAAMEEWWSALAREAGS
ncbi:MAG: DUF3865 domain-containing protein [Candidatus Magasanikbacteria bacterium]|nr:DUF3865 domain-containing protein [Candidatus Magasanikbacteria bacterium]